MQIPASTDWYTAHPCPSINRYFWVWPVPRRFTRSHSNCPVTSSPVSRRLSHKKRERVWSRSTCDEILIRCINDIQSDNRKFRSRLLVGNFIHSGSLVPRPIFSRALRTRRQGRRARAKKLMSGDETNTVADLEDACNRPLTASSVFLHT